MHLFSTVQTPTPNLTKSLDFYQKLDFQVLSATQPTLLTDGKFILEINPNSYARTGLKMYQPDWSNAVTQLEKITEVVAIDGGYLASDPNGVYAYLMNGFPKDTYKINGTSSAVPGNFAGLSIEAVDVEKTVAFWEIFAYQKTMGSVEQGWIAFDNGSSIGLSVMKSNMCPHLFFNPGLTFFNGGKNLPVIEKIRSAGIPIAEEITHFNEEGIVDNIIIQDPGGLGFFVFND